MIEIDCSCGETYWADDSHAGRSLRCHKCGKVLSIGLRSSLSCAGPHAALNEVIDATVTKESSKNRKKALWPVVVTFALTVRQEGMALARHMQALWPVLAAFGLIVVGVMLGSRSTEQPTEPPRSNAPEVSPVPPSRRSETPESVEPTAPIPASPAGAKEGEIIQEDAGMVGDFYLNKEYHEINDKHFGGRLPTIQVLWEPRLAQLGPLICKGFTQQGLWGVPTYTGVPDSDKPLILLNPGMKGQRDEVTRTLCHEMIHEYLFTRGDRKTNHGPAFQAELHRLLEEGAFRAILASEDEKASLRAWLRREQERLHAESVALKEQAATLDRDRDGIDGESESLNQEADQLNQRILQANEQGFGWPHDQEIEARNARALLQERRVAAFRASVAEFNATVERNHADVQRFNVNLSRYNLMMAYPDGLDDESIPEIAPAPRVPEPPHRETIPLKPNDSQPVLTPPDADRP